MNEGPTRAPLGLDGRRNGHAAPAPRAPQRPVHRTQRLERRDVRWVEIDGFAFHGSRAAFERDRLRDAYLQAAGYRVIRVTWRQLEDRPEAVIARVA